MAVNSVVLAVVVIMNVVFWSMEPLSWGE